MKHSEFVRRFAREYGYRKQDVSDFIENMSIFVKDCLVNGETVHLKGFLDFGLYNQNGRSFYDFRQKKPYVSGDRYVPTVKFVELYNTRLKSELDRVQRVEPDGEETT